MLLFLLAFGLALVAAASELVTRLPEFSIKKGEEEIRLGEVDFYSDQDSAHLAVHCAVTHDLPTHMVGDLAMEFDKHIARDAPHFAPGDAVNLASFEAHLTRADKLKEEGDFFSAAYDYMRVCQLLDPVDPASQATRGNAVSSLDAVLGAIRNSQAALVAHDAGQHEEVLRLLKLVDSLQDGVGRRHKNVTLLLAHAQSATALGQWSQVKEMTGRVLRGTTHRGTWTAGQGRSRAIELGSVAALNMGDLDKALSFWRVAIKADPDSAWAKPSYKRLRALEKGLKEVTKLLGKAKNRAAEDQLAASAATVLGLGLNTSKLLSTIAMDQCKVKAAQKRYEEALLFCDEAMAAFEETVTGVTINKEQLAQAHATRAEAHLKDNNFDEALQDFRRAQELTADQDAKNDNMGKVRSAEHSKEQWNKRTAEWSVKVLELPPNFGELNQNKKCEWIKKNFKKFVKHWHPDKAKGDKRRAARKVDEVSQAKTLLYKQFQCNSAR
jgi:tetratricopeptide (TPR) repeat protein